MYLRTCSNSKPTVDTAYPRAQKCSPVKFRSLPHKRAIAMALFPFRNPITEATGYFGGIAMHMCTWSGSRCPSIIWVAVGMPIAQHPPHRAVLARLTHTVLTSGIWRQSVQWDTGVGCRPPEVGLRGAPGNVPRSSGFVGFADEFDAATNEAHGS